jgi:hypothetical protein
VVVAAVTPLADETDPALVVGPEVVLGAPLELPTEESPEELVVDARLAELVVGAAVELAEVDVGVGVSETSEPLAEYLAAQSARPMPLGQQKVSPVVSWVQ